MKYANEASVLQLVIMASGMKICRLHSKSPIKFIEIAKNGFQAGISLSWHLAGMDQEERKRGG